MQITVVMPLYNKVAYVERAIRSVQAQTHTDWRLIVVDDVSTDGSLAIAGRLAGSDGRIQVIRRASNGGAAAARNTGILAAQTDWVAFLDADDEYLPEFLERLLWQAHAGVDYVYCNYHLSLEGCSAFVAHSGYVHDYPAEFVRHRGRGISCSSVMVRRGVLLELGGFPSGVPTGEDTALWLQLGRRTGYVVAEELAIYHNEASELSRGIPRLPAALRLPGLNRSALAAKAFLLASYLLAVTQRART